MAKSDQSATFDHLVVGSGLAGLTFALHAARSGKVCVLTKGEVQESNTSWAQGGIAAAVGEADSWQLHERDTLIAGAGLCKPEAVRKLVQEAPNAIRWLADIGASFDMEDDGDFELHREGGHSRHRIVHHADNTGWEVERAVVAAVHREPNITVFDHTYATGLLLQNGRCVGACAEIDTIGKRQFRANSTLLATGGCGRMYRHTTNPRVATADGIALASKVGARIENMEFMQFHPTTLYHPQQRSFLISEAVRGAGATLRNHLGRRFMYDYDARLELAPRDIVARAIVAEMKRLQTWCVYLDVTHLPRGTVAAHFPTIYETLLSVDIDMEKDWIPIVPAQHYSCGGVTTDLWGRSTVPGLYAAGEVACTGVHGGNRLASNSLLEAMVFAIAAAEAVTDEPAPTQATCNPTVWQCIAESDSVHLRKALGHEMTTNAGVVRTTAGLHQAQEAVEELLGQYEALPDAPFSRHPLETHNLMLAARHVLQGALDRKQNVGLHYNVDLPTNSVPYTPEPERSEEAVSPNSGS